MLDVNPNIVKLPLGEVQLLGLVEDPAVITGEGFTVIIDVAVFLHPVAVIFPVTVYVVFVVGFAVYVTPVVGVIPDVDVQE